MNIKKIIFAISIGAIFSACNSNKDGFNVSRSTRAAAVAPRGPKMTQTSHPVRNSKADEQKFKMNSNFQGASGPGSGMSHASHSYRQDNLKKSAELKKDTLQARINKNDGEIQSNSDTSSFAGTHIERPDLSGEEEVNW